MRPIIPVLLSAAHSCAAFMHKRIARRSTAPLIATPAAPLRGRSSLHYVEDDYAMPFAPRRPRYVRPRKPTLRELALRQRHAAHALTCSQAYRAKLSLVRDGKGKHTSRGIPAAILNPEALAA